MPAITGPNEGELTTKGNFEPLVEMPAIVNAKKFNTVIWAVGVGFLLYALLRLCLKKRIAAVLQPWVSKVSLELMDEIGYRSVLIGFPVFTLGALIFAMIWAHGPDFGGGILRRYGLLSPFCFMQHFYICAYPKDGRGKNPLGLG